MDFISELAKQGLGYFLFAGALLIIFFLYREIQKKDQEIKELANLRVNDLIQMKDSYFKNAETMKDAYFESLNGVKKVAENTLSVVQNLQQLLNLKK